MAVTTMLDKVQYMPHLQLQAQAKLHPLLHHRLHRQLLPLPPLLGLHLGLCPGLYPVRRRPIQSPV